MVASAAGRGPRAIGGPRCARQTPQARAVAAHAMVERPEEPETEAEQALDQASPAAVALALGRASKGGKALDAKAMAFLDEQTTLIRLQTEHLHEQRELQLAHLKVRRWKDRLSLALQALGIVLGVAVVVALGAMAWQAHQDQGLVVEAFSVPPDLAQRGLTGQVVAGQLLDKLSGMQARTDSARPARSYQNNWGDDLKVEIPETGVSFGELNRWLRQWLGNQTRVSGEVYRTPAGLTVSVRTGQDGGVSFTGPDTDVDKLVQQAAEAVYQRAQPFRYALWLIEQGRQQQGLAAMTALANGPAGEDRSWADGLGDALAGAGDVQGGLARGEDSVRIFPDKPHAWMAAASVYDLLDREQQTLEATQRAYDLLLRDPGDVTPVSRQALLRLFPAAVAELRGDFRTAAILNQAITQLADYQGSVRGALKDVIGDRGQDHDGPGADVAMAAARRGGASEAALLPARLVADVGLERWPDALAAGAAMQALKRGTLVFTADVPDPEIARVGAAYAAYARAVTGDLAGAQALISATPLDCYTCVRLRGKIAATAGDLAGAQRWFAQADRLGPSIPFADNDWGEMLLARGDAAGAIAKFGLAHQKGPHFADPLELWGEALMKQGDAAGAALKFAEAEGDAPQWGRNHLRRGQALARLGRTDEAKAQWRAAAGMELSTADRAELARLQSGGRPSP